MRICCTVATSFLSSDKFCQHAKMGCVLMRSPDPQMAAYLHQTRDPALGYTT